MYNVLIVDDEPRVLKLLECIIPWKEYGFSIVGSAHNGHSALVKLAEHKVDLLITDIRMPQMDGIQLIEACSVRYPQLKCIVLSAHDEFDYVKKCIQYGIENYILKPINKEELIETLLKLEDDFEHKALYSDLQFNAFRENMLKRWIYGSIDEYEFEDRASHANLPIDYSNYCVSAIKLFNVAALNNAYLCTQIRSVIQDRLRGISHLMFQENSKQFVVLLYSRQKPANVKLLLSAVVKDLKKSSIDAFITIGSQVSSYASVNQSYRESIALLDYSLFMYKNQIISMSDTMTGERNACGTQAMEFDVFRDAVTRLDKAQSSAFLNMLFAQNTDSSSLDLEYTKSLIRKVLLQLSAIIKKEVPVFIELPEDLDNLFEKYNAIHNCSNIITYLVAVTDRTIDLLAQVKGTKSPVVTHAINHIKSNYGNANLSQKTIADKLHVNPSYLGQIFKDETGVRFTTYLNEYRIDVAKHLIAQNKQKISEISKAVGYTHQSYFQKVFKKFTGMPPSEFKQSLE